LQNNLVLKKQNLSSTRKVLVDLDFTQLAWQLQRIYVLETCYGHKRKALESEKGDKTIKRQSIF